MAKTKKPKFEQVLEGLQSVVAKLETGSLDLEASMKAYENGVKLVGQGHALLDDADKRVEILSKTGHAEVMQGAAASDTVAVDE